MSGQTLYGILGIVILHDGYEQYITDDEIKTAYRKQASKLHPDVTDGDSARFNELKHARDVLLNPETRKVYDETGEVHRTKPVGNKQRVQLMTYIQLHLKGIIEADIEGDLETVSVPYRVLQTLEARTIEHEATVAKVEKKLRRARILRERLSIKAGVDLGETPNPIDALLDSSLVEMQRELEQAEEVRTVHHLAIEVWKAYDYRMDTEHDELEQYMRMLSDSQASPRAIRGVGGFKRLHAPPSRTGPDDTDVS